MCLWASNSLNPVVSVQQHVVPSWPSTWLFAGSTATWTNLDETLAVADWKRANTKKQSDTRLNALVNDHDEINDALETIMGVDSRTTSRLKTDIGLVAVFLSAYSAVILREQHAHAVGTIKLQSLNLPLLRDACAVERVRAVSSAEKEAVALLQQPVASRCSWRAE